MIIPFDNTHLPQVAEIERLCFSDPWSEKALSESLESPYSRFLVALDGDRVAGYIGLYALSGEGSITNVATHPDYRRQGLGRALIEGAIIVAEKEKLEYITLEVRQSNSPAISLYEKCGFKVMGKRRNFYSSPREDAIIMNYFFDKDNTN